MSYQTAGQNPYDPTISGYQTPYPSVAAGPYPQYSTYPVYQASNTGVPYQMMPGYPVVVAPEADGMSIGGMVLGIVSLVFGWTTVVMPIIGLVLSIMGQRRAAEQGGSSGMAIAGIVCNAIALTALASIFIVVLALGVLVR